MNITDKVEKLRVDLEAASEGYNVARDARDAALNATYVAFKAFETAKEMNELNKVEELRSKIEAASKVAEAAQVTRDVAFAAFEVAYVASKVAEVN